MSNEREFFYLPEDLPGRERIAAFLRQSGAQPVSTSAILVDREEHFQGIFDRVPISIWEEDFSQVKLRLDGLRAGGISDFMAFCNQNPDFVSETIALVKILTVNQTGIKFYGVDTLEQLLVGLQQFLHDESLPLFQLQLKAIWDGQTYFNSEGVNYTLDGKPIEVNVRWVVFPGCEETYNRVLLTVVDISKQQQIQDALKFSEERYQAISEITSDFAYSVSYFLTGTFKIDWVTESFTIMTGYTIQDLEQGKPISSITHPDDRERAAEAWGKIIQGQTVSIELRLITKSGSTRWVRAITRPIKSLSNPEKIQVFGAIQDITEQKTAELKLLETQQQLQLRVDELEKRSKELNLLTLMTNNLQLCHSAREAYDIAAEAANQLFPNFSGAIYMKSVENQVFQLTSSWGNPPVALTITREDCWALRRGAPFFVHLEPRTLICNHSRPISEFNSSLCMPFVQQGDVIGLFYLESSQDQPAVDPTAVRILTAMAEQFGLALTNLNLRESLSEQAVHDPLTGLYNRYYMEEFLEKELHRARRSSRPVSLIMIDMDHFRDLNALFGHPNVDITLAEVGDLLVHSIRAGDIACRYGGDEFLLILPEATTEVAVGRAEQLCKSVHSVFVRSETRPPQPISFSVGIACYPQHGQTVTELLRAADSAVFSAKDRGRDRVEIAG
jgi:diguanylate cyclase (GGDEF)-like protein/PAS domain S-box-containing protein